MRFNIKKYHQAGFSLVEMAVVLIILGFVLGTILLPLQAQRNLVFQSQTENTLDTIKQSLLGYAQSQGRLPCPATLSSNGAEALTAGACTQQIGLLPASTLGIQPTDQQGYAIDGWGNRIRYAVTQVNTNTVTPATPDFTTQNKMANVGIANLAPDIRVCASSTAANCTATVNLINNAVAVIYSLGETGASASGGNDENENLNAAGNIDKVFVSHNITNTSATNGEFDHIVSWISPYVLYNSMLEAGQLH